LTPEVYLPGREGSLQIELVATARRHDSVPYVLRPSLDALLAEVASGNPVLVMQNLGLTWLPRWHYAVVVGFDLDQAEIVLRSGRERRHRVALATFERTWRRAGSWSLVVLPPGRLPQTAEEVPYLESVVALERLGRTAAARSAYTAALTRWPQSLGARLGLGNTHYQSGDLVGAATVFRIATQDHPRSGAAHNNLAHVLFEQGDLCQAEQAARTAVSLGGSTALTAQQTLAEIHARLSALASDCHRQPEATRNK
jgi:tetratricopeptide (TPR) repeat protein